MQRRSRSNTGRLKCFTQDHKTPSRRQAEGEVSDLACKVKVQRDTTSNGLWQDIKILCGIWFYLSPTSIERLLLQILINIIVIHLGKCIRNRNIFPLTYWCWVLYSLNSLLKTTEQFTPIIHSETEICSIN